MNNKGFAVSAVLYTLLIAFLLFLGAALAMFSSSNSIIGNANNDIVNGNGFSAKAFFLSPKKNETEEDTGTEGKKLVVQIKSRYGIKLVPNDFDLYLKNKKAFSWNLVRLNLTSSEPEIEISYIEDKGDTAKGLKLCNEEKFTNGDIEISSANFDLIFDGKFKIKDKLTGAEATITSD